MEHGGTERVGSRAGRERLDDALARIEMLARACTGPVDTVEVLTFALRQGLAFLDAATATVARRRDDGSVEPLLSADAGDVAGALSLLDAVVLAHVAETGASIFVATPADALARFPALADLAPPTGAAAAVPLVRGGAIFGALSFGFSTPRSFDRTERRVAQAIADVCVLALGSLELLD